MKSYFAYIRVSTVKQGEHGSSLQEQRDAINNFAARNNLQIAAWFEERETAAKVGRREFTRMLGVLRRQRPAGVIFHKIDRSARNLKDWSVVQDLAEQGFDVRFTQESINLASNEGRLTGDFLAVIAAHYVRNLREEVRKGIRGRLKQGIYCFAAPMGYLDQGGGKVKIPDSVRAPYVRLAFEMYATKGLALRDLSEELYRRGFRSKSGGRVGHNQLAEVLRNPFYMGIIRLKRSGECFAGAHEPLISKGLFDDVQAVLDGKKNARVSIHNFLFRRMISCAGCGYRLIGETQKGHAYYRCHSQQCPPVCLREELISEGLQCAFVPFTLTDEERNELSEKTEVFGSNWTMTHAEAVRALTLRIDSVHARLAKLMDAYLDGAFERPQVEEKKLALLMEQTELEEQRSQIESGKLDMRGRVKEYIELVEALPLSYEIGNYEEKRALIKTITSKLTGQPKNVVVELRSPFSDIAKLYPVALGGPVRGKPRTEFIEQMATIIMGHAVAQAEMRRAEGSLTAIT